MKLLPTTDDSVQEDGSIPSFWYREYEYNLIRFIKKDCHKEPFAKWTEDNESLNRKPILKP